MEIENSVELTPSEKRPYSAGYLYSLCEHWAPELLEKVWDMETYHLKYDASEGTDFEAKKQIEILSRDIWHGIIDFTSSRPRPRQ